MTDAPRIVDNQSANRFETIVDGHLAELTYRRGNGRIVLIHTGVPDDLEGRGIGAALVRAAVGTAEDEGLVVIPRCPFARRWLDEHPDVAARVKIEWPHVRA
jgi:predicted GNAT family acetyltransferase